MTVETTDGSGNPITKSGPYNGNGVTVAFDYDFQIQDESELLVTKRDALGAQTALVLTTDYTVSGVGSDTGGQVTLVNAAALPTGTQLAIQFNGKYNQTTDYSNQGRIQLSRLEQSLDRITMHLRALKEQVDRSVKLSVFDGTGDLATLQANLEAVAALETEITTISGIAAEITTLSAVDTEIAALSTVVAEIASLSAVVADISAVAAVAPGVTTVAGIDTKVTALSALTTEIATLAAIAADIVAVSLIDVKVSAVAAIDAAVTQVAGVYQGALAADPTVRALDGSALQVGDFYLNTVSDRLRFVESTGPVVWVENTLASTSSDPDFDVSPTALAPRAAIKTLLDAQGWQYMGVGPTATTSGASFDINDIPAGMNEIEVIFDRTSLSGNDNLIVRLGTAAAFEDTGYTSYSARVGTSNVSATDGFAINIANSALEAVCSVSIKRLYPGSNIWVSDHCGTIFGADRGVLGSGRKEMAGEVTRLQLKSSGISTFDNGAFVVRCRK